MVDGCRSKLVNLISGVPQGSVLGPLLLLLYTSELFSILEIKLIGYADDSTLMAVVPSPGIRVTVAESLIHDLVRVSEWCDLWGMKLNASKTKTMIVSRSRTMHPQSPTLTIGRTVLEESDDLVILGVTFDSKMTFEKHLCLTSRAASQRRGIFRNSFHVFCDGSLLVRCFRGFVLPVLEYCSAVWLPDCSLGIGCLQSGCGVWLGIGCRYTPKTTGPSSQWCAVSSWGCVCL